MSLRTVSTAASVVAAANRFGLGARPDELAGGDDGRTRLLMQLRSTPAGPWNGLSSSLDLMRDEYALRMARREARTRDGRESGTDAGQSVDMTGEGTSLRNQLRREQLAEFAARYRHAAVTDTPFVERLVQFWSNHFSVSIDKGDARLYAAPMEREAIRPHVLGSFETLLLAVETHPAMLRYLDNDVSTGERSRAASMSENGRRRGLNENLAREILELHTLGVDGGYGQNDVTELARAITGWSVPAPREFNEGQPDATFRFRARAHEPGARTVLGRRYVEGGVEQGRAILADLARHPSTARFISLKLARHFVADQPTRALVDAMAAAYRNSGGDLSAVYRAMIESTEAWSPDARKWKTPNDFLISAMRAGDMMPGQNARGLLALLSQLGQPVFTPRSPAGFPDTVADWGGADALWKRLQAAQALAMHVRGDAIPIDLAKAVLGNAAIEGDFASVLRRAGSSRDGYALLFASPAFQWRV